MHVRMPDLSSSRFRARAYGRTETTSARRNGVGEDDAGRGPRGLQPHGSAEDQDEETCQEQEP